MSDAECREPAVFCILHPAFVIQGAFVSTLLALQGAAIRESSPLRSVVEYAASSAVAADASVAGSEIGCASQSVDSEESKCPLIVAASAPRSRYLWPPWRWEALHTLRKTSRNWRTC